MSSLSSEEMADQLSSASYWGDFVKVKELLKNGADPNLDIGFEHPLHLAKTPEIAQALLDHGANIERRNHKGYTTLQFAAELGSAELVRFWLDKPGAKIDGTSDNGGTVLHSAALNGTADSTEIVWQLLEEGADPNAVDKNGDTPLHIAAQCCNFLVTWLLWGYGSNVNATNHNGETPLHLVARCSNDDGSCGETAHVLLANGANVNARNKEGRTPLYIAAPVCDDTIEYSLRKAQVSQRLVNHGADVNFVKDGLTPLHCALCVDMCQFGDEEALTLFNLFLDRGVDVNAVDIDGNTPLHWAASFDNTITAQLLLDRGAAPDAVNKRGQTPLHMVFNKDSRYYTQGQTPWYMDFDEEDSTKDYPGMVQLLLDKGVNVNATDENGATPLHEAAGSGQANAAQILLDRGAHVDWQTKKGETPLHLSVASSEDGRKDFVQLLLDKGGNPNAVDSQGQTPLHKIVYSELGGADVVDVLLYKGSLIDTTDGAGKTPLHWAAERGMLAIVELLVNKGANIGAVDNDGKNPLYYGALSTDTTIAALNIVRLLLGSGPSNHVGGSGTLHKQAKNDQRKQQVNNK